MGRTYLITTVIKHFTKVRFDKILSNENHHQKYQISTNRNGIYTLSVSDSVKKVWKGHKIHWTKHCKHVFMCSLALTLIEKTYIKDDLT